MNYWTQQQLARGYHAGDEEQAALLTAENTIDTARTCGRCGGDAHYKHTVGTQKCIRCGALHIGSGRWE